MGGPQVVEAWVQYHLDTGHALHHRLTLVVNVLCGALEKPLFASFKVGASVFGGKKQGHAATNGTEELTSLANAQSGFLKMK